MPPVEYFRKFFDDSITAHIVYQSNLYAVQIDPTNPLMLTPLEFAQFLGVVVNMSIISLPRSRLYWSRQLGVAHISNVMSRERFEQIKKFIHFNDNAHMVPPGDDNFDRLFKVRPLLNHLQLKFNNIPMDQMMCVDEQMVPFKGSSSLKQYVPSKPHKYGYKFFVLCDAKGIIYNFEIYSGKINPCENYPDLGASSNIVLKLCKVIPSNLNHLLYFDNWFTSFPLLHELSQRGIYRLGTVRSNRLPGCNLLPDKQLRGQGRGAHEEKECVDSNTAIRVIKWFDSKSVTFLTSFESAGPTSTVKRWDKASKSKIDVPCPRAVHTYNTFMGGADLLDSLIGLYKIKLRSKKYYHRIFFHLIDLTVVTAWLLYKRDCDGFGILKQKQKSLLDFRCCIAEAMSKENQDFSKKRGRPSTAVEVVHQEKKARGHNTKPIPQASVRHDNVDHFPAYKEKRGRCKLPGCKPALIFSA